MEILPLWTEGVPHARSTGEGHEPTLQVFRPYGSDFSGYGLLILPGGGYGHLAPYEGAGYAEFFRMQGFTCFVLNYRLGSAGYRHPVMLEDAARAMRLIRSQAKSLGLSIQKLGVIGSSAGGHLAATLLTKWDRGRKLAKDPVQRVSSRPDFGILCYPVISLLEHTHQGSCDNLLGRNSPLAVRRELSAELHVRRDTPPCFVWHTVEDRAVPVENSLLFASALRRAGVPFELHLYERGAHGLGIKNAHPWVGDCLRWLRERD